MDRLRILVVTALAEIVAPTLEDTFAGSVVVTAGDPDGLRRAVSGRPRFDVMVTDLTWNDRRYEWDFDGLDALQMLSDEGRSTATIVAAQGHSLEEDHLAEALDHAHHPEVLGVYRKTTGLDPLVRAIPIAASGGRLPADEYPAPLVARPPALHRYFHRRSGRTAGHLAAVVASGRASNYATLARVAGVAPDTANKLLAYLGPIIAERQDTPPSEPITQASVFRWCEEHARYLLSWDRRFHPGGPAVTRWRPPPG